MTAIVVGNRPDADRVLYWTSRACWNRDRDEAHRFHDEARAQAVADALPGYWKPCVVALP